jgi:hypothetical protein
MEPRSQCSPTAPFAFLHRIVVDCNAADRGPDLFERLQRLAAYRVLDRSESSDVAAGSSKSHSDAAGNGVGNLYEDNWDNRGHLPPRRHGKRRHGQNCVWLKIKELARSAANAVDIGPAQ